MPSKNWSERHGPRNSNRDISIPKTPLRFRKVQKPRKNGSFQHRIREAESVHDGPWASQKDQNPAVSLRTCSPPAVSAKSKFTDRRVLRRSQLPSHRTFRNTTPTLATTSDDTRDLHVSAHANSATSPPTPVVTSRPPFPPQLSPLADSHIAPGYHPFGPLRMSKNTQLRPLSSFDKNEI